MFATYLPLIAALFFSQAAFAEPAVETATTTADVAAVTADTDKAPFPSLTLTTQHDDNMELPGDYQFILLSVDKKTGDWVTEWLDQQQPAYLENKRLAYVADIHRMPSLITKFVALPKMRDKAYPIGLGFEAETLAMLERQTDCLTLFKLDQQQIQHTEFICTAEQLEAKLSQ